MKFSKKLAAAMAAITMAGAFSFAVPAATSNTYAANDGTNGVATMIDTADAGMLAKYGKGSGASKNFYMNFVATGVANKTAQVEKIDMTAVPTGKTLKKGTSWKINELVDFQGEDYYNVGGDQFVKASSLSLKQFDVVHVNYNKHYGIQIWTALHNPVMTSKHSAKKLMGQTNWKVFGAADIAGDVYYSLGGDQYINNAYVSAKSGAHLAWGTR